MKNWKTILIIIAAIVVLWLLFSAFSKPKAASFSGTLVSAAAKPGSTNAYFNINPATTLASYWLTYTPAATQKSVPNQLSQSKEISAASYKAFISKYPTGLADGNVLSQYS